MGAMQRGIKGALVIVLWLGAVGVVPSAIPQTSPPKHVEIPEEQRVDINHASIEELLKVPGMTKSWAGRIVRFRPYRTKQDLVDRGIVSGDVYKRVKDYIIAHHEKQRVRGLLRSLRGALFCV
jgi:DNA uptake protein ComE-like DNA-binding protein